jgi:nicotinate-nucleotide pyrophosphorylase
LDNTAIAQIKHTLEQVYRRARVEVSGNISLEKVKILAEKGSTP